MQGFIDDLKPILTDSKESVDKIRLLSIYLNQEEISSTFSKEEMKLP